MASIEDLKPVRKQLVIDLLREASFDVGHWKNYRGKAPAANPKYCYNWSFEQPGEMVAVCLWHRSLKQSDGSIIYQRKPRTHASSHKGSGASIWNRRDAEFAKNLELAYRQQLPVR